MQAGSVSPHVIAVEQIELLAVPLDHARHCNRIRSGTRLRTAG
jgi:hypothetical protein